MTQLGSNVSCCATFAEPWGSGRCWNLSSCATWSSATCSWSAGSSSTCSRSVLCHCGCSISRWPAGSTSDWATASAAVSWCSHCLVGLMSSLDECGDTWTCAPKGFLNNWITCALVVDRDGGCSGVVVRNWMHTLHRPGELPALWKGERHCCS